MKLRILVLALFLTPIPVASAHIPTPKSSCLTWETDYYAGTARIIYSNGEVINTSLPVTTHCIYPLIQYKRFEVDQ